jgi:peptide chain release factor 3
MNWPIGDGDTFQGVYDRATKMVHLFERGNRRKRIEASVVGVDDPILVEVIGEELFLKLLEDIEVLDSLIPEPEQEKIFDGLQSPLFFGSAMSSFGVELFLKTFIDLARKPAARVSEDEQIVEPTHEEFTGFVFKLQANLDPRHRDRMAFVRVCSGTFKKGMKVSHSR